MTRLQKLELSCSSQLFEKPRKSTSVINIDSFNFLSSLQKLKFNLVDINVIRLIDTLKSLTNLKKLSIKEYKSKNPEAEIGVIASFFKHLGHHLEIVSFPFYDDFIDYHKIQKKNPNIKFRWFVRNRHRVQNFSPLVPLFPYRFIGVYEGELSDANIFDGRGCFYFEKIDFRYLGEFKNGYFEGTGRCSYSKKSFYDGNWWRGLREGNGIFVSHDGTIYNGEWKNDLFEGRGICIYPDGSTYEGEWKRGKKEGSGVCLSSKSGISYAAQYKNDITVEESIIRNLIINSIFIIIFFFLIDFHINNSEGGSYEWKVVVRW